MLITKVAHHFKSCRPIFLFNFFGALEGINLVAKTFFKFKFEEAAAEILAGARGDKQRRDGADARQ
jgi:hypothetical protein